MTPEARMEKARALIDGWERRHRREALEIALGEIVGDEGVCEECSAAWSSFSGDLENALFDYVDHLERVA